METYDVIVAGAGSGGFAAALGAARMGLRVLVLEKSGSVGGNANRCGVNNWEPVVGGSGFPFEIYRRLKEVPGATAIYSYGRHALWNGWNVIPGGEHVIDPAMRYIDTMRRHGIRSLKEDEEFARRALHGVVFEPVVYERTLRAMLAEAGRCTVLEGAPVTGVTATGDALTSVVSDGGRSIAARIFVDATGDGELCEAAGCRTTVGQESRDAYGEPSAPVTPNNRVNGVTLLYRITRTDRPAVEPLPGGVPSECWWRAAFPAAAMFQYPNGDMNINMLPTTEGREYLDSDHDEAYAECRRRALAHWHFMQTAYPEYRGFRIASFAEGIGVRESRRVVCEYVLTENDVVGGVMPEDTIALADHALDRHGERGGAKELGRPFGIPYRCLLPLGYRNLLVACRAAGFSSIAASSCRLSRTMMQLGQASGVAAALALRTDTELRDVPASTLRDELRRARVQLEHPMPEELRDYLLRE